MKTITITVDGNSVSREFGGGTRYEEIEWSAIIEDMFSTLENSNKKEF